VTVAVLIVYSLFSIKTAHDCVSSEVMRLVDEQTKESLLNRATIGGSVGEDRTRYWV
jgi:methyl-accepting chemotaxis protein